MSILRFWLRAMLMSTSAAVMHASPRVAPCATSRHDCAVLVFARCVPLNGVRRDTHARMSWRARLPDGLKHESLAHVAAGNPLHMTTSICNTHVHPCINEPLAKTHPCNDTRSHTHRDMHALVGASVVRAFAHLRTH
eukprot:6243594-Alexandrium_andersonii.AAC.1